MFLRISGMEWLKGQIRNERLKIIKLLLMLILSACARGVLTPPTDPCFEGFYSNGNISFDVIHNGGQVTATGWKMRDDVILWDSIYFNGSIIELGKAEGELKINFYDGDINTETDSNVRLSLTTPGTTPGTCDGRTPLSFSFSYFLAGTRHLESYSLERQP